jgi:hypothetical protein
MRPVRDSELRRGATAKGRPVQGSSPDDRLLRGPGLARHNRACADFFLARFVAPSAIPNAPGMRFLRHCGIYRPDRGSPKNQTWAGAPPSDGGSHPGSRTIVPMSSDRLFLDRVARQHCPSPLHRHPQINMRFSHARAEGDISTLRSGGHFYFALTEDIASPPQSVITES